MSEFYNEDSSPKKCLKCGCTEFYDIIRDTLDGHLLMEYSLHCKQCEAMVGYWAHGYFDPSFNPDFEGNTK